MCVMASFPFLMAPVGVVVELGLTFALCWAAKHVSPRLQFKRPYWHSSGAPVDDAGTRVSFRAKDSPLSRLFAGKACVE